MWYKRYVQNKANELIISQRDWLNILRLSLDMSNICRNKQSLLFHTNQIVYRDSIWLLPLPYLYMGKQKGIGSIHQLQSKRSVTTAQRGFLKSKPIRSTNPKRFSQGCWTIAVITRFPFPACFTVLHYFPYVGGRKGRVFRSYALYGYSRMAQISVQFSQ